MRRNPPWRLMINRRASPDMLTLEQIKGDVMRLSKDDQAALLDWLTNLLEDQLKFTDEFEAKMKQGEADIAAGRFRIVESDSARKEQHERFFKGWDATHSISIGEKPTRERTYSEDKPS